MARKGSRQAFLVLLAVVLVGFGYLMQGFWVSGGLALITALILRSLHEHLEQWCRGRRYIAATLTLIVTSWLIMIPLAALLGTIVVEIVHFSQEMIASLQGGALAEALDGLNAWVMGVAAPLEKILGADFDLRATVLRLSRDVATNLYRFSPRFVTTTAHFGLNLALWAIFLFVFFADGPRFYRYIMETAPIATRHERAITHGVREMVSAVFLGIVVTAAANAVLMGIAFAICGIDRPWMWGLITLGFSFVPLFGAFIIWCGGAIYLLLIGKWAFALGLAVFGLGIIAQVDNVIKPWVMRGRVNIHPLFLLLSILGGVQAMGPPGLIFGPVFVAILSAVLEIYRKEFVE